jgi:hypothetical protein
MKSCPFPSATCAVHRDAARVKAQRGKSGRYDEIVPELFDAPPLMPPRARPEDEPALPPRHSRSRPANARSHMVILAAQTLVPRE